MENITISNKTIIEFYNKNPHLNIENINIIFIEILKKLSTDLAVNMNNTSIGQILGVVNEIKGELYKLNSDITVKLLETKKQYIDDIKLVLEKSDLSTQEKINHLLEKSNDALFSKTTNLINDVLPKSQDKNLLAIENKIKTFADTISKDTTTLLQLNGKDSSKEIFENIEKNFNKMVDFIQKNINNSIRESETRTHTNIQQVNEKITLQKQMQETLNTELSIFLNKYKSNSSVKGSVSESELYSILQVLYPSDEISRCNKETAACDIKLKRMVKTLPTIFFENKDYTASVDTIEVDKFERDLKTQQCHGIFLSQKSPITYKSNFHIDIIGGLIHIYIPNACYDPDKIKLAVSIIDSMNDKIAFLKNSREPRDKNIQISEKDMEDLTDEYRIFANKKNDMMDLLKTFHKQMTDRLEEIQLPCFRKLVIGDNESTTTGFLCPYCKKFMGKNKGSLSSHTKKCKPVEIENTIFVQTK